MVNHLKKFFKSITKPNSHGTSSGSPHALLASNDNQYSMMHESFTGKAQQRSPPNGLSDNDSNNGHSSPPKPGLNNSLDSNVRWGLVLSRIPKLVADCTNHTSGGSNSSLSGSASPTATTKRSNEAMARGDFMALLEQLRQMSAKEYQAQILQYYTGSPSPHTLGSNSTNSSSSGRQNMTLLSNWEQRKVFKQCRRALLLGWKFILAQLNDEKGLNSETRDLFYQIISLMVERVEFNLLFDGKETQAHTPTPPTLSSIPGRPPQQKQRTTSQSFPSLSPPSTSSSTTSFTFDQENSHTDENNDGERDLYLYRCLLVATYKHVIENMEAGKLKKRSFISFSESQFYAKIIAISFFRIPVVQRMVLDHVLQAYGTKRWVKTSAGSTTITPSSTNPSIRPSTPQELRIQGRTARRRSSSKPWNGMTFVGSLSRWSEFDGHELIELYMEEDEVEKESTAFPKRVDATDVLSEPGNDSSMSNNTTITSTSTLNPFAPPNKSIMDKYRRQNPTLFRWARYSPYLGPYADCDVFRTYETTIPTWLSTLTQDGEFFACFMASYMQHAGYVSVGEPIWYCLPGYPLLVRISLLIVKEAAWQKWLQVQDTTENIVRPMMSSGEPSNQEEDHVSIPNTFVLKNVRAIKTVLDSVVHLLRNRETLESCVLAVFECTNVLNNKSVGACLGRLEEWFGAVAVPVEDANELSYKLPSSFHGNALATGIRIMLCSESFETLNRVLSFLYNRMDYFDGELRQNILKAIVQRHMYLFLHWNADVRDSYHHLLVYKIVRVNRYLLDSAMDQLLIGRVAMFATRYETESNRSDTTSGIGLDGHDGPYDDTSSTRPVLTPTEVTTLRLEQALWRAFDACLACICVQERKHAREGNRKYQHELHAAQCRAVAFKKLSKNIDTGSSSTVNEGLPGGKPLQELELLPEELHREPPYFLRYLPAEEVSSLDELRRLASNVKYPADFQVYAAHSLRHYSDMLKEYFSKLRQNGHVEAPPLGFC